MSLNGLRLHNEQAIALNDIPQFDYVQFSEALTSLLAEGQRLCAYFGDRISAHCVNVYAICADDRQGVLNVIRGAVVGPMLPSLTTRFPQVHLFEREIYEQTGLLPDGHPWLKPVRFPTRQPSNAAEPAGIGIMDYFRVAGDEVHEVAVGPVHAGIIEPGHFRFQCHGETVYHLEISLGYQHRGIEAALIGGPYQNTVHLMETIAGDTTVGHKTAYCQILESLGGIKVPPVAAIARAVALELERCANHTGDLGALAGDIGYLPTMSYCGRIRGDFLNMTALICGNRFGRNLVIPGGVGYKIDASRSAELLHRIEAGHDDFVSATGLLWEDAAVLARFEKSGALTRETAEQIGLVGPAARACGCSRDIRQDHAYGYFRFTHIPVSSYDTGDVFARAYVRWQEVQSSIEFIRPLVARLSGVDRPGRIYPNSTAGQELKPNALAVSLVEGWRGEICHVAVTDAAGRFKKYKIIDPSFHNWFGLALALRDQQISDFPLCNKSFNLSYSGFDL